MHIICNTFIFIYISVYIKRMYIISKNILGSSRSRKSLPFSSKEPRISNIKLFIT